MPENDAVRTDHGNRRGIYGTADQRLPVMDRRACADLCLRSDGFFVRCDFPALQKDAGKAGPRQSDHERKAVGYTGRQSLPNGDVRTKAFR